MSNTYNDSSSSQQGFPTSRRRYKYVDKAAVNQLLLCSVCQDPFVDPVTDRTQRRGCRSCFTVNDGPFTDITEWIVIQMINGLLVECTQCGETNIRREVLEKHEQTACKRAMVSCTAVDIKCPWKGARIERDRHLAECIFEPLRPALAEIITENKQLREKIEQLERQMQELRAQDYD